jgi:hypothetical protein
MRRRFNISSGFLFFFGREEKEPEERVSSQQKLEPTVTYRLGYL